MLKGLTIKNKYDKTLDDVSQTTGVDHADDTKSINLDLSTEESDKKGLELNFNIKTILALI